MKKVALLGLMAVAICAGLSSCNKCYSCTKVYKGPINNIDSTYTFHTDICNNGAEGAGVNLDVAVEDMKSTGYVCTSK